MARVKIEKLHPATDYVVQVRAVRNGNNSKWSEKFNFTTIDKDGQPGAPTTTWEAVGDAFVATWTPVSLDVDGESTRIVSYELEFGDIPGNKVIVSKVAQTGANMTYTLSYEENTQMFYTARGTLTFRVRAVSNKGRKGVWSELKTASNGAPAEVTNFVALPVLDGVELSWDANTDNDLVGYNVHESLTENFEPSGLNLVFFGNATRFTYPTSTYLEHYFAIQAVDKMGQLSPVVYASGTPISPFFIDITPPDVPTGLSATITNAPNGIDATAAVSWTMDSPPEDLAGFWLRFRKVGTSSWYTSIHQKDDRSAIVELPEAFVNYEFQIRAADSSANDSDWSAIYTAVSPANTPPANVTGLTAEPGMDSITYYWNPTGDSDLKNYELTFSSNATFGDGDDITFLTGSSSTLTVGGLVSGTTYRARVRAVDTGGLTSAAWSATNTTPTTSVSFDLSDGNPPTSSPAASVSGGIGYLFVSWPTVANADLVKYEVHISTTSTFTPTLGSATKVAETPATNIVLEKDAAGTALAYGTTYYVRIIAKDEDTTAGNAPVAGTVGSATLSKVGALDSALSAADVGADPTGTASTEVANYNTNTVQPALNGKNKITHSTSAASGANIAGDTWIQYDGSNQIIAQSRGTGGTTWVAETVSSTFIASLDAGKISAGSTFTNALNVKSTFTLGDAGTVGSIKSYNHNTTNKTGFALSSGGLEIWEGKVIADALVTGNLTSATITLATGGIIKTAASEVIITETGITVSAAATGGINAGALRTGTFGSGEALTVDGNMLLNGNMQVQTGGYIKSTEYTGTTYAAASAAGWYFGRDGLRISTGAVSATALTAGTLGSSTGVINIAAGASLVFNGGYMKSNTYTGTTQATNPSGAGFYLGNDGIRIDQGIVSAAALTSGSISGTKTIELSGSTAYIQSAGYNGTSGFRLSGSGLEIPNGSLSSAKLSIQSGFGNAVVADATVIDGGKITTGTIQSSSTVTLSTGAVVKRWAIATNGAATLAAASIYGNTVLGIASNDDTSYIQSANYSSTTGWQIKANGYAYFGQLTAGQTAKVEVGNHTVSGIATNQGMVKFGTPSVYQPGVILGTNSGSTYSELRLQGPYSSTPTQAARLVLMEYGGTSRAQLFGEQVTISGNSFYLDSSDSSSYNFRLTGTSGVSWLDSSTNRIRFNLGTGTNTITSANSSNTSATLRINAQKINFDVSGGDLEMQGGSNIGGRLGRNSTGGCIAFPGAYVVAGIYTYNAATPNASNTVDMYADKFRSFNGLFDTTYSGGAANYNASGRVTGSTSSINLKKYVHDLTYEEASKALDLRAVSFVYKAEMDMGDQRVPGFIAEEAHAAGMEMWVGYDKTTGDPAWFRYAEMSAAHNVLIKDLYAKNEALETRVTDLEARLVALESSNPPA